MNTLSSLFEPNYTILTFLVIKTFFYVEFVGLLGLLRAFAATGRARMLSLVTALIALATLVCKYIPELTGYSDTEFGRIATRFVNQGILENGSGMALACLVSFVFALSWRAEGRRWWALDVVHVIGAIGFFGLWLYTKL